MMGVSRVPMVAPLGTSFAKFHSAISQRLATVGYASSMSVKTYGVEWKRGELAAAAAREAGLPFKVAGSTGEQISLHDMPEFYRSVDAVLISSISESGPLPVIEAAAAGRLVIGTPVGHFPLRAYQGGGIIAPIEAEKYKAFTTATLRYYKENPAAYVDKCHGIQEAARKFDWQHMIGGWIELIEAAK
jgi:glycosyltransferase involved in cell wall biosynthesis